MEIFAKIFAALGMVIGAIFGVLGLAFAALLINSYVVVTLWGWFITPIFKVQAPGYLMALGVGLFASLYTSHGSETDDSLSVTVNGSKVKFGFLLRPLVILLFGWILHSYLIPHFG